MRLTNESLSSRDGGRMPLRVLLAEDNPNDAELVLASLQGSGFEPNFTRVESEADFRAALALRPEVVISDFSMRGFDGLRAFAILKESAIDIPFILVSGTVGEETAVEAMREGVADYVLKDRMNRLGSAVINALARGRMQREQQRVLDALRESEDRFRQITEHLDDAIWISDLRDGKCLYVNHQFENVWGLRCSGIYNDPQVWQQAVHGDDRQRVVSELRSREPGMQLDQTYRIVHADGATRWIRFRTHPIRDESGAVYREVCTSTDITDQRRIEEQMLRSQRLEAIGTLSSGIAHDLNNILAPTLMVSAMLRDGSRSPGDGELIDIIEAGAKRGADIIQKLLTFTRGVSNRASVVDPRAIFTEMLSIIRETFPKNIQITGSVGEDLPPIMADSTQIHQVLMNLCVNARDAMKQGGNLNMELESRVVEPALAQAHPPVNPGPFVVFSVTDTGHGIAPDIMNQIFEPFFTTKPVGEGTGLGLSTVMGIVRSHRGFITVASKPGKGSQFRVYLPAHAGKPADAERPAGASGMADKAWLVLLVDDEKPIRFAVQRTLEKHGYRVITAADGREAFNVMVQRAGEIDLLLADLMMPLMSGTALIRSLRRISPGVKVVAMTGLEGGPSSDELAGMGVTDVLRKPFTTAALVDAVRRQFTVAN